MISVQVNYYSLSVIIPYDVVGYFRFFISILTYRLPQRQVHCDRTLTLTVTHSQKQILEVEARNLDQYQQSARLSKTIVLDLVIVLVGYRSSPVTGSRSYPTTVLLLDLVVVVLAQAQHCHLPSQVLDSKLIRTYFILFSLASHCFNFCFMSCFIHSAFTSGSSTSGALLNLVS